MTNAYVNHLSFALGDDTNTLEQSAQNGRLLSEAAALKDAGFTQHHICHPRTSAYQLAKAAVQQIQSHLQDIGAIIYSTCIPTNGNLGSQQEFERTKDVKHLMDFPVSHLQTDFNLSNAAVIGLNQQACTGMLGSLRLAKALLSSEPELKQVLCVTADRFPEGALYEQAYNLISDGAAACIVSSQPNGFRLLACHAETNGAMSFASDDETVGSFFNYSHAAIQTVLKKAGITIDDVTWIIPQNTNRKAWQVLSNLLRFDFQKVYFPTLPQAAHVISGDNIINLICLLQEQKVQAGDKILLFMAGYGLNWQCVVLERV